MILQFHIQFFLVQKLAFSLRSSIENQKTIYFFFRYEASNDLLGDMECQKRAICEVYKNSYELGAVSERARHSLDYLDTVSLFNLPDEFLTILDEFMVSP